MDQRGQKMGRDIFVATEDVASVRVPKTAELVAGHLRELIVSGALRAGEHLPPEAALTAAFMVARPTLREALRILESEGLIAVTRGARTGARVLRPSLAPLLRYAAMVLRAQHVGVDDIIAARRFIESEAVRQLAIAGDRHVLATLHAVLAAARRTLAMGQTAEAQRRLDAFALLLVEGAGNATMTLLATMLARLRSDGFPSNGLAADGYHRLHATLRAGERVVALVAANDADGAAQCWRDHLGTVAASAAVEAGQRLAASPTCR